MLRSSRCVFVPTLILTVSFAGWSSSRQPTPALGPENAPLPAGAVLRLGANYLRSEGPVSGLAVLPGGKQIVTAGKSGLAVWDLASGQRAGTAAYPTKPKNRGPFGTYRASDPALGRYTVQCSSGTVAVAPDGKSLLLRHYAGKFHRYALPLDDTPPIEVVNSYGDIPAGLTFAPPITAPFGLTARGRLGSVC